jgi:hypothetical protein
MHASFLSIYSLSISSFTLKDLFCIAKGASFLSIYSFAKRMVWTCDCGFRTRGRLEDILAHVRGHHDIDIRTGLSHFAHCNEFNCCRFNGHGRRINWKETQDCDEIVITPTITPILCTLVVNSEDGLIKHLEDSHGISLRKAEP